MASARLEQAAVDMSTPDGRAGLRATGSVVLFNGFFKLYQEGRDDQSGDRTDEADERRLPKVAKGETVRCEDVRPNQHFTEPPPRFTEATLVKRLEELGIGRPSTYASIISVLQDRDYVRLEGSRFVPDDRGRLVTAFLGNFFNRYVAYDFTARLEETLDDISAGNANWKQTLHEFWNAFSRAVEETKDLRTREVLDTLNEALGAHFFHSDDPAVDPRTCPSCDGGQLSLKLGRFGAFIGCSNYPDCRYTRRLVNGNGADAGEDNGPRELGLDPETGGPVTARSGPYGHYAQLDAGPQAEDKKDRKPKRVSLPPGVLPTEIDLDTALALLALPREVGASPGNRREGSPRGSAVSAPTWSTGANTRPSNRTTTVLTVGINRAVVLLADAGGRRRGREALKELGDHPDDGKPVVVMDGRYGPYVKHGRINATLPKGPRARGRHHGNGHGVADQKGREERQGPRRRAQIRPVLRFEGGARSGLVTGGGGLTRGRRTRESRAPDGEAKTSAAFPSREQVLRFIHDSPDRVGKRDIARVFGISGTDRARLKELLGELSDEGLIEKGRRRSFHAAGELPPVTVIEITGGDADGELHARPTRWDGEEEPPRIVMVPGRTGAAALAPGDRALARLRRASDGLYEARVMRRLENPPDEILGVYNLVAGHGRIAPTDRRVKREFVVAGPDSLGAPSRRRRARRESAGRATGTRQGADRGAPRLLRRSAQLQHDRHPQPGASPPRSAPRPWRRRRPRRRSPVGERRDLRELPLVTIDPADARDRDDAVWAAPDTDPGNPGGWKIVIAIADVAAHVRPGSALDADARERGNSVYFPDRVAPMLPEALSSGLCSLEAGADRACLAAFLWIDADGNPRRHEFVRGAMRAAANLTYQGVQDLRDGRPPGQRRDGSPSRDPEPVRGLRRAPSRP